MLSFSQEKLPIIWPAVTLARYLRENRICPDNLTVSELFFEELRPLCTISAITIAQYKPYSTILLFLPSLICLYLKIHQKQSPVQQLKMVQFCHNVFFGVFFTFLHPSWDPLLKPLNCQLLLSCGPLAKIQLSSLFCYLICLLFTVLKLLEKNNKWQ